MTWDGNTSKGLYQGEKVGFKKKRKAEKRVIGLEGTGGQKLKLKRDERGGGWGLLLAMEGGTETR